MYRVKVAVRPFAGQPWLTETHRPESDGANAYAPTPRLGSVCANESRHAPQLLHAAMQSFRLSLYRSALGCSRNFPWAYSLDHDLMRSPQLNARMLMRAS